MTERVDLWRRLLPLTLPAKGKLPPSVTLKQGTFYYHYRFPEPLRQRMYPFEIRISLCTGYRAQALRIARILHVYLPNITEGTPFLQWKNYVRFCISDQTSDGGALCLLSPPLDLFQH